MWSKIKGRYHLRGVFSIAFFLKADNFMYGLGQVHCPSQVPVWNTSVLSSEGVEKFAPQRKKSFGLLFIVPF